MLTSLNSNKYLPMTRYKNQPTKPTEDHEVPGQRGESDIAKLGVAPGRRLESPATRDSLSGPIRPSGYAGRSEIKCRLNALMSFTHFGSVRTSNNGHYSTIVQLNCDAV